MKEAIIVGSGISGATLANYLANKGWRITVFEKNNHIGGNCYDYIDRNGILIHKYGPHIFHTNNKVVYDFVKKFGKFNSYKHKVLVNVDNKIFPLPINFESIRIIMKDKAEEIINILLKSFPNQEYITIFDLKKIKSKSITKFTNWIAKNVYFNYSSKMWGTKFEKIDPNTISRVKIILSDLHNYFPDDKYQGLPCGGYTNMIKKMLHHKNIKVLTNVNALDYLKINRKILWQNKEVKTPIIYCGPIDELLNYKFGMLQYRSLDIRFEHLNEIKHQNAAVVNYPAHASMTRITEYKIMTKQKSKSTTISREYPGSFKLNSKKFGQRYYPIINNENTKLYQKYVNVLKKQSKNIYLLGRLAQYKYFDMDDAIQQALELGKRLDNA